MLLIFSLLIINQSYCYYNPNVLEIIINTFNYPILTMIISIITAALISFYKNRLRIFLIILIILLLFLARTP